MRFSETPQDSLWMADKKLIPKHSVAGKKQIGMEQVDLICHVLVKWQPLNT